MDAYVLIDDTVLADPPAGLTAAGPPTDPPAGLTPAGLTPAGPLAGPLAGLTPTDPPAGLTPAGLTPAGPPAGPPAGLTAAGPTTKRPTKLIAEPLTEPSADPSADPPTIAARVAEWVDLFDQYIAIDLASHGRVAQLNSLKVNLNQLIGSQKKDDVQFYRSIIENSHFYLSSSLRVRRAKFLCDISAIWGALRPGSALVSADRNIFLALTRDLTRGHETIVRAHQNCTTLSWVKRDQIDNLQEVEVDLGTTLRYHIELMTYFNALADLEFGYYSAGGVSAI